jgi:3-oxoacyl-[acyl-carrier protein] reductase
MNLQGDIAIVTGASRGIGRAIASSLGRSGAYVIVNYRANQAAAEETLNGIAALGGQGELCPFDIAEESEVEAAVKKIVDRHMKIDILVNNAGVTSDSLLLRMKPADWDRVIGTNLKGTVLCTKAVSRVMIRQHKGRIVNLSSVVGQMGNAGQALYAASKAGITVNAVAPGFIETDMTMRLPENLRREFLQAIPLGRFGTCEDVAEMVLFLAGSAAAYVTGQVFNVNGGLYM